MTSVPPEGETCERRANYSWQGVATGIWTAGQLRERRGRVHARRIRAPARMRVIRAHPDESTLRPCTSLCVRRVSMRLYASLCVPMRLHASPCVSMRLHASLCVRHVPMRVRAGRGHALAYARTHAHVAMHVPMHTWLCMHVPPLGQIHPRAPGEAPHHAAKYSSHQGLRTG